MKKLTDSEDHVGRGRQPATAVELSLFVYGLSRCSRATEHLTSLVEMMKTHGLDDFTCEATTLLRRDIPKIERRLNFLVNEMNDFLDAVASGTIPQRAQNKEKTDARKKKTN